MSGVLDVHWRGVRLYAAVVALWCMLVPLGASAEQFTGKRVGIAEEYVNACLNAADIWHEKKAPLFRSVIKHRELTERSMHRNDVLGMIKYGAKDIGPPTTMYLSIYFFREHSVILTQGVLFSLI
jgi:hypothetical protein